MGKLIVSEFVTLDGVAQSPGRPDEDDQDFTHGGWQIPLAGNEDDKMFEQAQRMDAMLLGRKTYEIFANFWPTAPEEIPFTNLINRVPKYVASRTLVGPLDWNGSTVIGESLVEEITMLKERHGEIHVAGSLDLVQSLLRFGLIDRFELLLYPVVLGGGKRVFADGTVPSALRLVDSVAYSNGVLHLSYETSGTPSYGAIGMANTEND